MGTGAMTGDKCHKDVICRSRWETERTLISYRIKRQNRKNKRVDGGNKCPFLYFQKHCILNAIFVGLLVGAKVLMITQKDIGQRSQSKNRNLSS